MQLEMYLLYIHQFYFDNLSMTEMVCSKDVTRSSKFKLKVFSLTNNMVVAFQLIQNQYLNFLASPCFYVLHYWEG